MFDHIYDLSYTSTMINTNTLFSALSNEIRLRCLMLMQDQGELCVCELTHALNLSQPMISRHLAVLKESGIVSDRREGQWIYYQIKNDLSAWAQSILNTTAKANISRPPFQDDLNKLAAMANRPKSTCCN